MLPLKRFGYVLLIVAVLSVFFLMYDLMDDKDQKLAELSNPEPAAVELLSGTVITTKTPRFCLVGSKEKELYSDIYENVSRGLTEAKLLFVSADRLNLSRISEDTVLIFCDDTIEAHVDLEELVSFIMQGGKAVFAAGIAEGYKDSYLQPIFGIIEKSTKANYLNFTIEKPFLPLPEKELTYSGFSASTWISVRKDAEVYFRDSETKVPVLYEMSYGNGKILMLNATFLEDYQTMGIFFAALGTFTGDLMYPVLGVKCVFLDNYPVVTGHSDKMSMRAYGRTLEALMRDSVWPQFEGMAVRRDLNYTISILGASSEKQFPEVDESMYSLLSKSLRRYGGELVYGISNSESELVPNSRFLNSFSRYFSKYQIRGAVVSGRMLVREQLLKESIRLFGNSVVAFRTGMDSQAQTFWYDETSYGIPYLSVGRAYGEVDLFQVASGLTMYGMISHVYDMNALLFEEGEPAWDSAKKVLSNFEDQVLKPTEYLNARTLGNLRDIIESYLEVQYSWKTEGNSTKISCTNFRKGQTLYYWTEKQLAAAQGLEAVQVQEGMYLLKILEPESVITWK